MTIRKNMTIWVVRFNEMIDFLEVEDAALESYVDELVADDGENFGEVMKELFSHWCHEEFGWNGCESAGAFNENGWFVLF